MWSMPEEKKVPTRKEKITLWLLTFGLIFFIVFLLVGFLYLVSSQPVQENKNKTPVVHETEKAEEIHFLRNTVIYFYIMSEL